MSGYIGPIPVPQATQTRDSFTATASQTTFNTSGYTPGYLDVFLNGVKLVDTYDYTATNGSDVVLAEGAFENDTVDVVAYQIFQVADQDFVGDFTVDSDTLVVNATNDRVGINNASPSTALDVTGDITVSGTVDGRDVATDGSKLDGIEANADVTDTANVTAAGALMDSEVTNLDEVKAFSSADYATAAQGTTADAALPKAGGTMTGTITFASGQTFDGRDVSADGSKLDGIESNATADQSAAEIKTAYESNNDTNAYTDAEKTKLSGIESNATADQTGAEIKAAYEGEADTNAYTDAEKTKLSGIETGATADQTKADIDALNIDADTLDGQHGSYYTSYTDTAISNLVDTAPNTLNTLNELAAALGDDANFSTTVTDNIATKLPLAGGTMTGAITFASGQTFDGRDVSADGSKLDGIESGATADQTASEILTAIKTVDGSSSGLDADLLDGVQGSSYLRSDANDSMSGQLTFTSSSDDFIQYNGSAASPYFRFKTSGTNNGYIQFTSSGIGYIWNDRVSQGIRMTSGLSGATWYSGGNYYPFWHSGNDGSGSGLDADTLDGVQGSSYLRSDTSDTMTGNLVIEDAELHVGDTSEDSWTRIKHAQADGYGFDWEYSNATVIVNEQGTTNEAIAIGDVTTGSGLFGVSWSNDGGSTWNVKLDLSGNGNLSVAGTITGTPTATLIIYNSAGSAVKTINGIASS